MLPAWVQALVAAAGGVSVRVVMVGRDACIEALPIPVALAQEQLQRLLRAYHQGLHGTQPWPTALKTGMAYLAARLAASDAEHSPSRGSDSALKAARSAFEGHPWQRVSGEGREPCLARLYPDADTLVLHPQFGAACETLYGFYMDWLHTKVAQVQLLEPEGEPGAGAS
jgi:exodeoxyribonuclease V gamma subunit